MGADDDAAGQARLAQLHRHRLGRDVEPGRGVVKREGEGEQVEGDAHRSLYHDGLVF